MHNIILIYPIGGIVIHNAFFLLAMSKIVRPYLDVSGLFVWTLITHDLSIQLGNSVHIPEIICAGFIGVSKRVISTFC